MNINKNSIYPFLLYSRPINYESIVLYPVKMKDILEFQLYSDAITVRKNSIFPDKKIIKMSYLDFLLYAFVNSKLGDEYNIPNLKSYYVYALQLLKLVCCNQEVKVLDTGIIYINDVEITSEIFDDLRRIIILQNDIDFDIDEFINKDTEEALKKASEKENKIKDKVTIEDYIDSLSVALHLSEDEIMNMSIRKFWRFIKRFNLHESYTILKTGEASGMVTYKEPIKHWMISIDEDDRYSSLKTDEKSLKDKISGSNS